LELIPSVGQDSKKGVMLFEDATYFAVDKKASKHLSDHVDEIYVLADDLAARGFRGMAKGKFKEIDYGEAVNLIMECYDRTISV
ncbi:MAG TPA: DsrH/TusB family sulfur metabolism protein, partial [Methanomassiliicoccales archaeon]|nr:DsrH/TusB family sulfur metabolism protein [Methanomassiliicoccales archaeon]